MMAKLRQLGDATEDLRDKGSAAFSAFSSSLQRISTIAIGVSVSVVGALTAIGFSANQLEDSSKRAFTQLLGDGQLAIAFYERLLDFAAKTPFELATVMDSAKKLMSSGMGTDEIVRTLTNVGDAIATLGGGDEKINRIIDALGKMKRNTKVAADEMQTLGDAGIMAWQILAEKMGKTVPEVMKLSEQGLVSADEAIAHLMEGIEEQLGGGMEKAAGSFGLLWSNMLDTVTQFAGAVARPLYEVSGQVLAMILSATELPQFAGMVDAVKAAFKRLSVAVFGTATEMMSTGHAVSLLESFLVGAIDLVTSGVNAFRDFWPQIKESAAAIIELVSAVTEYLMAHPELIQAIIALKVAGFLGLTQVVTTLIPLLVSLITWLGAVGTAMTGASGFTMGWQVALAALVAYLVFEMVTALTGAREEMAKLNDEMKRGIKLNDDLASSTSTRQTQEDKDIAAIEDPAARAEAEADQWDRAKQNLAGLQDTASAAAKNAQTTRPAIPS